MKNFLYTKLTFLFGLLIFFFNNSFGMLAFASDNKIYLWKLTNKGLTSTQIIKNLEEYEDTDHITASCFSSCGNYLVYGTYIGNIQLWDLTNKKAMPIQNINDFANFYCKSKIESLLFTQCGKYLISMNDHDEIILWKLKNGKLTLLDTAKNAYSSSHNEDMPNKLSFSNCKNYLASINRDKSINLWKLKKEKLIHLHNKYIYYDSKSNYGNFTILPISLGFSQNGKYLIILFHNSQIRILKIKNDELVQIKNTSLSNPEGLISRKTLVYKTEKLNEVVLYEYENGKFAKKYNFVNPQNNHMIMICLGSSKNYLATLSFIPNDYDFSHIALYKRKNNKFKLKTMEKKSCYLNSSLSLSNVKKIVPLLKNLLTRKKNKDFVDLIIKTKI